MSQTVEVVVRVNASNPRHHIWNNNGTWFVHYTVYTTPFTKRRVRASLGAKRLREAQRKRDQILGRVTWN